jgi:Rieske Fe-S protein
MVMGTRRRTVLAAGAAGAAALVTGCGDNSDGGGATAPEEPTEEAAATAPPAGEALARTSEIPVGGGKVFADREVVVTQPTAGDFRAFSALCTHQRCTVGSIADGLINCPCHSSKFRITDGSVVGGPATRPLSPERITVSGDSIQLT